MSSVPELRQTPGGLYPQRSKARGDIVPSEALLPQQAANMAVGILSLCRSPGRTQAPHQEVWQMNLLCVQFLRAGRPLTVFTPRDLKLRVIQYLMKLFCPSRQRIWLWGLSPSAVLQGGQRTHTRRSQLSLNLNDLHLICFNCHPKYCKYLE